MSSLAQILYPPPTGESGMQEWYALHLSQHQAIITGLKQQRNIDIPLTRIYPVDNSNIDEWARQHQALHSSMTAPLGLRSDDFTSMDFSDKRTMDSWYFRHWLEHTAVSSALGLTI